MQWIVRGRNDCLLDVEHADNPPPRRANANLIILSIYVHALRVFECTTCGCVVEQWMSPLYNVCLSLRTFWPKCAFSFRCLG